MRRSVVGRARSNKGVRVVKKKKEKPRHPLLGPKPRARRASFSDLDDPLKQREASDFYFSALDSEVASSAKGTTFKLVKEHAGRYGVCHEPRVGHCCRVCVCVLWIARLCTFVLFKRSQHTHSHTHSCNIMTHSYIFIHTTPTDFFQPQKENIPSDRTALFDMLYSFTCGYILADLSDPSYLVTSDSVTEVRTNA